MIAARREADRQPVLEAAGIVARIDADEPEADVAERVAERERHPPRTSACT